MIINKRVKEAREGGVCVTKVGRDEGIIGGRKRDGRKLWRFHCAELMNSGIQMVVGGDQTQ